METKKAETAIEKLESKIRDCKNDTTIFSTKKYVLFDDAKKILEEQTTSQQQTIEHLEEELKVSENKLWEVTEERNTHEQTIERLYNSVVNVKNPYSEEKQYQQWAAAENVLDTIIRSAPFQEVKQILNTTKPIDQ